jgi:hypothetical protein
MFALLALAIYAGVLGSNARRDLVTLHVRNASIPSVVRSLRWQTWENIVFNNDIHGTVTLDVDKMPLEQVLEIMSEQIQARWTKVYPIFRYKKSLASLESAIRGEIAFSDSSFTNFQSRAFGPGGPRGGFGPSVATNQGLVSLVLSNKDQTVSALALSRSSQAQVVPENGYLPKINLELKQVPVEKAIDQVADQARRSWTRLYALLPSQRGPNSGQGGPGGPGGMPPGGERQAREPRALADRPSGRQSELLDTLPPEERQAAELRQEERQAMAALTPELRAQVMAERMNNPEMQQRGERRETASLRNSTPEQRRDRYERMYQMRKARAAMQAQAR